MTNLLRIPNQLTHPRGMALVGVFMVLALLTAISIALLQVGVSNTSITDQTRASQQALMMAQAGMNQAINELNLNKSLTGSQAPPGNPAANWGTQQRYSATTVNNNNDTLTITSIGTFANFQSAGNITTVQRKLKTMVMRPTGAGKFVAGGFGKSSVTLTGNASTNSYDSALPVSYAQQVSNAGGIGPYNSNLGRGGHIASNGTISGNGNTIVNGDATPGPNKGVSLTGGATVTGSTAPATSPIDFSPYVYSPTIASAGNYSLSGQGSVNITAGTYRYSSWKQSGKSVLLSGGVINLYIDGDFTQSGQGVISLAAGTTLNIYQGSSGKFSMSGQGVVNQDLNPNRFNIVSASTSTVDITGQGQIFGTVYAPSASVKISGQGEFFGAVIGNDLTLNGQGTFHYDKSATSPGIKSGVVLLASWEEDI